MKNIFASSFANLSCSSFPTVARVFLTNSGKLFDYRQLSKQTLPLLALFSILLLDGCSLTGVPLKTEGCKIHTYINLVLTDYLKGRFDSQSMIRTAVVPFDVPETFAPPGNESLHYGRELARKFQQKMNQSGEMKIVEVFNRDRWPGKRAEFYTGNFGAVSLARAAGFDFVLVGYLEPIKNDSTLEVQTKLIDTQNQVTVWSAKTDVYSTARAWRRELGGYGLTKDQPAQFEFAARSDELADCTVGAMLSADNVE